MAHLYELSTAYRALQDTEELTEDELATCLNNIADLFNEKAGNIGKLVLSLKANAEAIDTEINRLGTRKQALDNRAKSLKNYLAQEMEVTNTPKIKNEVLTISLVNNPPSVSVVNEELIPYDYWRVIPERKEVDKLAILSTYKESGTSVNGVEIIADRKHVVIR